MTTTATFVPTTKSLLLPLVVLFVWVAQVCSIDTNGNLTLQVGKWQPNFNEKDNLAAIEAFRQFVAKSELRSITRVTMKDNNVVDEVRLDPNRCAKRVLCVAVKAITNAKFFGNLRAKLRANFIEDYTQLVRLFNDFKLLPSPPINVDSNYDDISRMHSEFYDGTCPLYKYYGDNRIKRQEKKIQKFSEGGSAVGSKNYPTQVMRLANFFVPLAKRVIEVYDEAIDYIIQQYETECIDKRSKVQQYPKYYLMVLWSSFMPHTQFENEFNAFIATACPIVPLTIDGQHSVKICDMRNEGGVVDVYRAEKLQISNKVADLWKYLEMVKGTTTRGGLLAKLKTNFTEYFNEKVEKKRKAHDDNLWIGYQKKLIVQQTVLRVMEEDFKTAEAILKAQKDKLLKVLPNGQIPDNIVTEVHSALLGSAKYRTLCTNEWTTKGKAILTSVLMLVYQANVQFELNSPDCTTDPERDKRIVNILPAEMQMFLPPNHKATYRGVAYEALVDSAVGLLEKHSIVDKFEQFAQQWQENERNMIMAQMMFTVDADVMALLIAPNSSSVLVVLPPSLAPIETIHEQKCRKGWCACGVVALLIVGGTIWKLWNNDNNDTDALSPVPISNSTDQSIIDGHPSINVIVIVVTVIYALFVLCALFCLIRRYRNLNKKKNMKANKKKNKSPNSPEQSSALFPSTAPSSSVASGISSCAGSSASASSISSTSPSSVDTIDGQPWYRNGTQKLNIWIAIGILVLTGGSIVAYCFLGNNSSSTIMTIVGVVALIIMTILLVGSGVLYLIYRGKGRTSSQSEQQLSKKKPTACTGSAVDDESILCGTSSAASSAASLSVVVPSSVASSVSDASTLHRAASSTVVSVVASNNKRSPAKGGNKASKSPLPTRTKSPTPPKPPSTPTRKAYTSAFPSSSVLTTTTNLTCSPKMESPSLANKPLARKSHLKGPSLPTRVKSPTGKGTTNPQNDNPKGAQKKDSK